GAADRSREPRRRARGAHAGGAGAGAEDRGRPADRDPPREARDLPQRRERPALGPRVRNLRPERLLRDGGCAGRHPRLRRQADAQLQRTMTPTGLPLGRFTVIDLTRARSGPTAVRQLAEMGANVIQVAARSDDGNDFAHDGFDYQNLHRNKRAMSLDLKKPRGVEILKKLVAKAD